MPPCQERQSLHLALAQLCIKLGDIREGADSHLDANLFEALHDVGTQTFGAWNHRRREI